MTNWVDHRLTITGPEMELKRFANCFVKAKEGDLFPQYFIDNIVTAAARTAGWRPLLHFDDLGPRAQDSDKWVLAPMGHKVGRLQRKIEVAAGEIKLAWQSDTPPHCGLHGACRAISSAEDAWGTTGNMG